MTIDFTTFPRRTVHLDFHTGPDIPDIGAQFNPDEFARTFTDAHVDSVTVFAKDHHGLLYYDTDRPERHPGLPRDLDLLGEQIAALHAVGIRAPIYLSAQCDEWAADTHPEWIALDENLRQVKSPGELGAYDAGWQILDMASPYQDFLAEQIEEVLQKYSPVDGIFLDMCWDQPSSSIWARRAMMSRGMDPADASQRDEFARLIAHEYMERYKALIEPALHPGSAQGTWFNSRPKTRLYDERNLVRHVEIESLPSGGWGYAYLPYVARFVRPLGLPTLSHTGRFHKSWGDNGALKNRAALLYECAQVLSQGLTGGIGDLLPPSGRPDPAVYDLVGSVYEHIEACEPFVAGGTVLSEVALILHPELGDAPGDAGVGAVRMLQQLRHQFDVVAPGANLAPYRLAIVPESTVIDHDLAANLRSFIASGGSLVVSGDAAVAADGTPAMPELGIETHGASPYSHVFFPDATSRNGHRVDYKTVMYERTNRLRPTGGAREISKVTEPYFDRRFDRFSGHEYTVASRDDSAFATAVKNGRVVTIAAPIFGAFAKHGNAAYREFVADIIDQLLLDPILRDDGPSHMEATVVRTGNRTVVHLLSFIPSRLAEGLDIINDPVPIVDVHLRVRVDAEPASVSLQPQGDELPYRMEGGYLDLTVSFNCGHTLLVID